MTVMMCVSFLFFWTPYALVSMIKSYAGHIHIPNIVSVLPAMVAKTSHAVDPIIYCAMNKNFARYIPAMICRKQNSSQTVVELIGIQRTSNQTSCPKRILNGFNTGFNTGSLSTSRPT